MFLFKKIATALLLPSGIVIIVLLGSGLWFFIKKWRAAGMAFSKAEYFAASTDTYDKFTTNG